MAFYYCKHLAEFALFAQRIKSCSSSTARVHDDIIVMRSCLWKGSSAESLEVLRTLIHEQKLLTQTSVTVLSLWYIARVAFLERYTLVDFLLDFSESQIQIQKCTHITHMVFIGEQ